MPSSQITLDEIYQLVDQLDRKSKTAIFERIKGEALATKWEQLLSRLDQRLSDYPLQDDEITAEVELARTEYAKNRR